MYVFLADQILNALHALASILPWNYVRAFAKTEVFDVLTRAGLLLSGTAFFIYPIKRYLQRDEESFNLLATYRDIYMKMIIVVLLMNPVSYKAWSGIYVDMVESTYNAFALEGSEKLQVSFVQFMETIEEEDRIGPMEILTGKFLVMPIVKMVLSTTITLSMVVYWLLLSIVPLYVLLVLLVTPIMVPVSILFDGVVEQVIQMHISGLIISVFVGIALESLAEDMNYHVMAETIKQGQVVVPLLIGMTIILVAMAVPKIMDFLCRNAITGTTSAVLTIITIVGAKGKLMTKVIKAFNSSRKVSQI